MKTQKFKKKLQLNKKTVVDLNGTEMKDIQGGGPATVPITCIHSCLVTDCEPPSFNIIQCR